MFVNLYRSAQFRKLVRCAGDLRRTIFCWRSKYWRRIGRAQKIGIYFGANLWRTKNELSNLAQCYFTKKLYRWVENSSNFSCRSR